MKRSKPFLQICLLSTAITAITACGTMQNYQSAINTWHNAPATALMRDWGRPTESAHLKNGNELLTYRVTEHPVPLAKTYAAHHTGLPRLSSQSNEAMLSHTPKVISMHSQSFWCETQFEVNASGIIVNTHFEGNNCVASKMKVKRLVYTH